MVDHDPAIHEQALTPLTAAVPTEINPHLGALVIYWNDLFLLVVVVVVVCVCVCVCVSVCVCVDKKKRCRL